MTRERNIERLLDQWFGEGPTEAPDRVIDTVGDRIERLPQRPVWRQLRKERPMSTLLKTAAAVAAVLVLVVVGYGLSSADRGGIGGPPISTAPVTPEPTTSPAPSVPPGNPAFACRGDAYLCSGPLDAGEHVSTNTDFGLSFTVPAGWSNTIGQGFVYTLNAPGTETDATSGRWIEVFQDPRPAVQDAACTGTRDDTVGHGVQDLVGWFRAQPALDTTTPAAISIGGDQGTVTDVSLASTWTGSCSGGGSLPMATVLSDPPWTIAGPGKSRLIFLDIDSVTMLVLIETSDKADFDGLLAETMPIVQSMHLTH